ncbi:MAG: S-methyl-5'-thioinosine phosphorylase [Casimicrobium sp.]
MFAVIGGSGVVGSSLMSMTRRMIARTPYGEPSGPLNFAEIGGKPAVFIARHGPGHIHPPHKVNYRANLWALKDAGAKSVISIAAVGGISAASGPGTLIVPDQIIDYTYGREHTFFDGGDRQVRHIDFTLPYDMPLRAAILAAAKHANEPALDGGVYGATQGPRLETAAEINRLAGDGATLVGMTGMPEAALARELDLPYVHICVVANWAAGRGDSKEAISHEAIEATMRGAIERVGKIIATYATEMK